MALDALTGPSRRRADALEQLLAGDRRTTDPELAPLVTLARRLEGLPDACAPAPDPAFRAALRRRLLAVAQVAPQPSPGREVDAPAAAAPGTGGGRGSAAARPVRQRRPRMALAAGALAGALAVCAVGVAGARSDPGDPLYGVRRGTEALQLAAARTPVERGRLHLRLARARLREVERLAGSSAGAGLVVQTLRRMDGESLAADRDLTAAYRRGHDTAALRSLAEFADRQRTALAAAEPRLPEPARPAADASLGLLGTLSSRTATLLRSTCGPACPPEPGVPSLPLLRVAPGAGTPCPACPHAGAPGAATVPPSAAATSGPRRAGPGTAPRRPVTAPVRPAPGGRHADAPTSPASRRPGPSTTPPSVVDQVGQVVTRLPAPVTPRLPAPGAPRTAARPPVAPPAVPVAPALPPPTTPSGITLP